MRTLLVGILMLTNTVWADGPRASGEGEAGAMIETKTGPGANASVETNVEDIKVGPQATIDIGVKGGVQIQPKQAGADKVSAANGELKVDLPLVKSEPPRDVDYKVALFGKGAFDRELALDKPWDARLGFGFDGNLYLGGASGYARLGSELGLEAGGKRSGTKYLPYFGVESKSRLDGCVALDPANRGRNSLCFIPTLGFELAFVQAAITGGLGIKYEYRISDAEGAKSDSVRFRVGPEADGTATIDLAGRHQAGKAMLSAGLLAF